MALLSDINVYTSMEEVVKVSECRQARAVDARVSECRQARAVDARVSECRQARAVDAMLSENSESIPWTPG